MSPAASAGGDAAMAGEAAHPEHQYNTALGAPAVQRATLAWAGRAADARRRLAPAEIAYGPHPRERLDLFRADGARGAVVHVHGGYFKGRGREDFSWIADGYVGAGYSVAVLGFPLCPEVAIPAMADSVARAVAALWLRHWTGAERSRVLVVGHSSGAYLAAALQTVDWSGAAPGRAPFHAALLVSGIYDLSPLLETSVNAVLGLSAQDARDLDLRLRPRRVAPPTRVAVGAAETAAFADQARALRRSWSMDGPVLEIPGCSHFDILDDLVAADGRLRAEALRLLAADAAPEHASRSR